MKGKLFATFVSIAIILLVNVSATKDCFSQQDIYMENSKLSNDICKIETLFDEVWVDDSFKNINRPDFFTTISEGINNVNEGGTVWVWEGYYTETIVINKPLNLMGNGTKGDWNTIIRANEPFIVHISHTNNVSISGFSTIGVEIGYKNANILIKDSPYCNISHNEMPGEACAIRVTGYSNHTTISSNEILNCICDGIVLVSCYNNISHNIIRSSKRYTSLKLEADGIQLEKNAHFNNIYNNTIKTNLYDGIWMDESDNNIISNNTIMSNGNSGIHLSDSSHNTIFNNTIKNNGGLTNNRYGYGIIIFDNKFGSNENSIYHNNLIENRGLFNMEINAFDSNRVGANKWYNEKAENREDDQRNTSAEKGGNYWSDYEKKYPGAVIDGLKGTWNLAYRIPTAFFGRYPMNTDGCPFTRENGWRSPRNSCPLKPDTPYGNPVSIVNLSQN